jgi:hypothetical protein
MGKNNKPILSVLVDADKKERFADLARQHKQSMGWVLNDCIDRMLAAGSIDIYVDSIGSTGNSQKSEKVGVSALDIEEIIKTYASTHLDIPSIDSGNVEELVRASIETALQPINESVRELETYTQSEFAAVRDELKKAIGGHVATDAIANQTTVSQIFDEREEEPESTPTAQTPNSDYLDRLGELVGTGMNTREIAQKLTDEGFTNREGGAISRKSIESKLKSNHELKEIYTNARTSGGSVE